MKEDVRLNQALYSSVMVFDQNRQNSRMENGERVYFTSPRGFETTDDGSMVFHYYAPDAKSVEIRGWGGTFPKDNPHFLQKREDGWWEGIVPASEIEPGFHYHDVYVDGVKTLNPREPIGYGASHFANYCDTPDPENTFYLLKDVPHGSVRMELYHSDLCNMTRNCWVYLPPNYDKEPDKRYPVWYLHHGGGENEVGWIWQGKVNLILDNLLAAGECEEMIVVMNSFDTFAPTEEDGVFRNIEYCDVLAKDCVPFIDKKYRTLTDRDHRAVAGLSFGVVHSYLAAFKYPELFAWLGCFSGHIMPVSLNANYFGRTFDFSEVFKDKELFNSRFRLMWHGGGFREGFGKPRNIPGDVMPYNWEEYKAAGYHVDGQGYRGFHEWDTWRFCARDFAKRLFK